MYTVHVNSCINLIEYICYGDGCHHRKYARNSCRSSQTSIAKVLAEIDIVIDKMHMAGHVDKWCKANCDPELYDDLKKVHAILSYAQHY